MQTIFLTNKNKMQTEFFIMENIRITNPLL